ncbi:MAG: hypothetical protein GPI90_09495 [Microcystis aeruginosa K13-05]|jgi:hypothetical protein|uniref:hypothetical protein n=1 Tax=unclassified Microcystis TaxID=2643300 RepID=UPI0022BF9BE5|nr:MULTISPECIES: hypothetical protein [unclassified Microcystis]MCZ8047470.1 hypothetical protein [Microcystis sp. LE19-41.2A]MCZ8290529.1 hypothetical protein [Microcystis sp. LE19-59.1C]NCR80292.1 hypothetical protein [Microcystis aeruginosa K13-10]NCR84876.1 hypothetical protein [Microcystis aeruginosa K13-05]
MTSLQIINPTNHARFECLKPVTFTGKVNSGIVTVELTADDKYSLGNNQVKADGSWSITYSGFTNPGDRKITAIAHTQTNQNKEETSILIHVAAPSDYTKTIYEGLVLDAYKNLQHTQSLPTDHKLSQEEGCRLFEQGILPILQSKETFMEATEEGHKKLEKLVEQNKDKYGIHLAPCAYSVSCVMKYLAEKLGLATVKALFQDPCLIDNVQVTGVETKLRRLGFLYFLKEDYLAPRGAIGARAPRNNQDQSYHIYYITKDGAKRTQFPNPENDWDDQQGKHEKGINGPKWQIKDLHAENLDFFDHVYIQWENGYTEGFWLPPGIYPLNRGFNLSNL